MHLFFLIITLDISSQAGMCIVTMPKVSSAISSKPCIYNVSQGFKKYAKCLVENKNNITVNEDLSDKVNNTTMSDINATEVYNSNVALNSTNSVDLESTTKESKHGSITSNSGIPNHQHDAENNNSTTISVVTFTLCIVIVLAVTVVCVYNREKVKAYWPSANICRNSKHVNNEQESTDSHQDEDVSSMLEGNGKLENMSLRALLDVKEQPTSPE